jgi:hypothetical protein
MTLVLQPWVPFPGNPPLIRKRVNLARMLWRGKLRLDHVRRKMLGHRIPRKPMRRVVTRINRFCQESIRKIIFVSPVSITPFSTLHLISERRFPWLNSQWKLRAHPRQILVQICG